MSGEQPAVVTELWPRALIPGAIGLSVVACSPFMTVPPGRLDRYSTSGNVKLERPFVRAMADVWQWCIRMRPTSDLFVLQDYESELPSVIFHGVHETLLILTRGNYTLSDESRNKS